MRGGIRAFGATCGLMLALFPWAAAHCADKAFRDPLDVAAVLATRASDDFMVDVARAGDRLVAVGNHGIILLSEDGGNRWSQMPCPVSTDLTAVAFPTATDGWVVGHDGVILRSRDGGRSWVRQADGRSLDSAMLDHYRALQRQGAAGLEPFVAEIERRIATGSLPSLFAVWFADNRTGYAVGSAGLILITENGGESWVPWMEKTENPQVSHFYAVTGSGGAGGAVYVAGEVGLVLRLDRVAGTFVSAGMPYEGTFFSVAAVDDRVLVGGLRGNAFASADGGRSWSKLTTGTQASLVAASLRPDGTATFLTQGGEALAGEFGSGKLARSGAPLGHMSMAMATAGPGLVAVATDSGVRRMSLTDGAR